MHGEAGRTAYLREPQPVEVQHRGGWLPGVLLGWQHDETGHCRARVRCVVDGLRHTAWTELADLRLPVGSPDAGGRPVDPAGPPDRIAGRPPVPPPLHRRRRQEDDTRPHQLLGERDRLRVR